MVILSSKLRFIVVSAVFGQIQKWLSHVLPIEIKSTLGHYRQYLNEVLVWHAHIHPNPSTSHSNHACQSNHHLCVTSC